MTRAGLRDLAIAELIAAGTGAGENIRAVSVVPTTPSSMPILFVQAPQERKVSLGRGGVPRFFTSVSLVVVGRVTNPDVDIVQADLDLLIDQVHRGILESYQLLRVVQQFVDVETSLMVTGEASQPIGEASIHFVCELYQAYEPVVGEPLLAIDLTLDRSGQTVAEAIVALPQT